MPYAAGLTKDQVLDLLARTWEGRKHVVNEGAEVELEPEPVRCPGLLCFNVGAGAFNNSTLLRLLNQGDYDEVPAQLRRWVHCNGAGPRGADQPPGT